MLIVNESWKIFRWRCVCQRDNMCYWWEQDTPEAATVLISTDRRCIATASCPRLEKP